jgi:uncharacterized protein (TIGR03000 family)
MYSLVLMMAVTTGSETPAFGRRHDCSGGCHGGYASCSGYSGGSDCCGGGRRHRGRRHGCHGGSSCCGSYSSGYGCHGGYGCSGGHGCSGSPYMGAPQGVPSTGPRRPPETVPAPKPGTPPRSTGTEETRLSAPATITVSLPADARLTVDDTPTMLSSANRTFVSPELAPDKTFYYTFTGEIFRDGQRLVATKQVPVHAGESTQVNLEFPALTLASK